MNAELVNSAADGLRAAPADCCPVCEGTETAGSMHLTDYLHGVPGRFAYSRCADCGSVYQNPRVIDDDLSSCYPPTYFTHTQPRYHLAGPKIGSRSALRGAIRHYSDGTPLTPTLWPLRALGRVLARVPAIRRRARYGLPDDLRTTAGRPQRCLEVGPGQGIELAQLTAIGWEAVGLEFDPGAAETARRVSGCEVKVGTLATSEFAPDSFHLIYMSHVLEHLPDLVPSLRKAYELLAPGGRLVTVYPNPDSLAARWYGDYSCNWDAPRHLVLPSERGISSLLSRLGFERVKVTTLARRAAAFRSIALAYRRGDRVDNFAGRSSPLNRVFRWVEVSAVICGCPVGEEIRTTAFKPAAS
jgi:SAM-dependent methyltransferase